MSSAKWRPFCQLGDELIVMYHINFYCQCRSTFGKTIAYLWFPLNTEAAFCSILWYQTTENLFVIQVPGWFLLGSDNVQYIPVYPKKYAHGFVVLCLVVVMQSFIMNSHEVFIHIHQGCFAGTGAIVRLPQCQWSKPDGYGKISQGITTTKHSKAKTVCIFLGIYCTLFI